MYSLGQVDGAVDEPFRGVAPDVRAVGVQSFPDEEIDGTTAGVGVFAINAKQRLGTSSVAEFDVLLDTDRNGEVDHAVIGVDFGLVAGGAFDGQFASVTFEIGDDGSFTPIRAFLAGGAFNSSTVTLPFALADVGLSAGGETDLTYKTAAY